VGARAARAPSIFVLIILILFGLKVGRIWHVTSAEIGSSCPFVMCIVDISIYDYTHYKRIPSSQALPHPIAVVLWRDFRFDEFEKTSDETRRYSVRSGYVYLLYVRGDHRQRLISPIDYGSDFKYIGFRFSGVYDCESGSDQFVPTYYRRPIEAIGGDGHLPYLYPRSMGCPEFVSTEVDRFLGGFRSIFSGSSGYLSIVQAFPDVPQLHEKEGKLTAADRHQEQCDSSQSPSGRGEPPFVRRMFICAVLFVLDVGLAFWGGENFYRKRYLIGAASIAGGWFWLVLVWGSCGPLGSLALGDGGCRGTAIGGVGLWDGRC
jgi:hypothetical protein